MQGLKESGIENLDIYLLGTRMFMIMEVNERLSFEKKAKADQQNRECRLGSSSCGDFSERCRNQSLTTNGCDGTCF